MFFILASLCLLLTSSPIKAEALPVTPVKPPATNSQPNSRSVFQFSEWKTITYDTANPIEFHTGDFNSDGLDDLLYYQPAGVGLVYVALSTGAGFADPLPWTVLDPTGNWQLMIGDYDSNGTDDLAAYRTVNGDIFVGPSDGTAFNFDPLPWATVSPAAGWVFTSGDFTNDGFDDLAGYYAGTGAVWVGRNDTGTFQFGAGPWITVSPAANWQFVKGDFDDDGLTDLGGYQPSNGSIWQLKNVAGLSFTAQQLSSLLPAAGWSIQGGQFESGGRAEFLASHNDGNLWVGRYSNVCDATYSFSLAGTVTPATGWQYSSGDFNGDAATDTLAFYLSSGGAWVGLNQGFSEPVGGYAWPQSAAPGGTINFYASGFTTGNVEFYRHVADELGVINLPVGRTTYVPTIQTTNNHPERFGAGWGVSFSQTIPDGWKSGIYSAMVLDSAGVAHYIPFVVKPKPSDRSTVAVLANVNTWLAYNGWGCGGKYDGKANVSFLRPNPGADPFNGADHLTRGELWTLGWLEREGYAPDVYTDLDFHNFGLPPGYNALVLTTHPEYWSSTMMDKLRTYLNNGGSLAYLGGNGLFERGAYYGDQTGMVFREGVEGGPREDALFRRLPVPDPEHTILGVATAACGVVGAPYAVRSGMSSHFLLAGTGLSDGSTFGSATLSSFGGGASGWETDTATGAGAIGIPTACGMDTSGTYPVPAYPPLPAGFTLLAKGTNAGGVGGDMTYYPHAGGGLVFSVGSLNFSGSLPIDAPIQQIVRNVLAESGVTPSYHSYLPILIR
jgi:hypothetical protein